MKLSPAYTQSLSQFLPKFNPPYSTPFTTSKNSPTSAAGVLPTYANIQAPTLRDDRPALVVSSTSWTEDEDFGILKGALELYERKAADNPQGQLPKILMMITGKGPLRQRYMEEMAQLEKTQKWKWVRVVSAWLEAGDYPVLLGTSIWEVVVRFDNAHIHARLGRPWDISPLLLFRN